MGKALIFKGITVRDPLTTVTLMVGKNADYYVSNYAKLSTNVTIEQKTALLAFVTTMIESGIWAKVLRFFPMLGGIDGYIYDVKSPKTTPIWAFPGTGLSWDSTRNAPYLSLSGFAAGIPLEFTGLNVNDCAFLINFKNARDRNAVLSYRDYSYDGLPKKSFAGTVLLQNGGYVTVEWEGVGSGYKSLVGYSNKKNDQWSFITNYCNDAMHFRISKHNTETLTDAGSGIVTEDFEGRASFAIGGFFAAESVAPQPSATFNGCINEFICFDQSLADTEIKIVKEAVDTLNGKLGRNVDFVG